MSEKRIPGEPFTLEQLAAEHERLVAHPNQMSQTVPAFHELTAKALRWAALAEQDAEEPEWETKCIEQARIHYRYGVNSGTLTTLNTPEAIADTIEREERRTMGPIGAGKIETRTKVTRTSPWRQVTP